MKRLALLWALCLTLPVFPGPRTHQVRLACWNLHNFFDEQDDPYDDVVYTHEQVETKLDQLACVLRELQADVVGVEEVETRELLERLAARVGGFQQIVLVPGNDRFRGINVGLLSRVPIVGFKSHKQQRLPQEQGIRAGGHFSRDCLEVHLGGSLPFVALVNHFKSKAFGGRTSEARRRAQADGVVEVVRSLGPGTPVAVIGDLNDGPHSWALEPLEQSGLVDPFASLPLATRYTLKYQGHQVVLDHILLNNALSPYWIRGSARVWRSPAVERTSDHCPIAIDLGF